MTHRDALLSRLAEAYADSGLTLSELASRLGTKASTVTAWFPRDNAAKPRRLKVPGGEYLSVLPEILGVSTEWLLTGRGTRARTAPGEAEWRLQLVREVLEAPYVTADEDEPLGGAGIVRTAPDKVDEERA